MTVANHYEGSDEILRKLHAVQARRWTLRVGAGIMAVATAVLACVLLASVAGGYWRGGLPPALRWTLLAGGLGAIAAAAIWFLLRALLWRQTPAQIARFVEQRMPDLKNDLINPVLLAADTRQVSPPLVQRAIDESVQTIRAADISESVSLAPIRKWGISLGAVLLILAAFVIAQPGPFARGLRGLVSPSHGPSRRAAAAFEDVGEVVFVGLTPGSTGIYPDEPVVVVAEVYNSPLERIARTPAGAGRTGGDLSQHVAKMNARVLIRGRGEPAKMKPEKINAGIGRARFSCVLTGRAQEDLEYAVLIGGRRKPAEPGKFFRIRVVAITGVDIRLEPPAYTAVPPLAIEDAAEADRSFEAPQGTRVSMLVRLSGSAARGWPPAGELRIEGRPPVSLASQRDSTRLGGDTRVNETLRYSLEIKDSSGRVRLRAPADANRFYEIRAVPDRPPEARFVAPARDVSAAPGETVGTRVRLRDDYGLSEASLHAAREGLEPRPVHGYKVESKREGRFDYEFEVPAGYAQGSVIVYHASATDNRELPGVGGGQRAESSRFKILVQDAARLQKERAQRYEELRRRLLAILKMQEAARVDTEICRTRPETAEQAAGGGGKILTAQAEIKSQLHALAHEFPFDADMIAIQQAVAVLARDEAQLAIDRAKVLAALKDLEARDGACLALAGTQDRIIDALRTMLAIIPALAAGQAETARRGEDLPPDVKEKLAQLKKELEKFIDAQNKVIEASERLTKTPVDNFTAEDEKLLKAIQEVQDQWEKFLNEAAADFSKLAEQDFSNPSMLKELVSVKSDVTMARDALSKKAVEIATAFEDNGIENAKSLTANIEKWLPDEPDRIKWSMEDPVGGQENIEQAELPTELEDLVGDLLEEEEDLFDEADDLTSKYAMSGDKGIGWDAMDGPISSMNAQGVTGNQLPNTSELSGRSGEGRQGKSSGEFVEDKAVGKGGRRTPTRLTPDAFQAGQVDDKSTEPPGGATGGGKLSGAGAEGLEGPVPPPLAEELKRLAGRQAVLVNRAERISARFQVNDYAAFRLLQAITLMKRVEGDLRRFRYRNVLRARDETLGAIRQSKLLLDGKIDVATDRTQTMPKYVRDDIADAMKGELPEKFRRPLQQYYRRLSEQAGD